MFPNYKTKIIKRRFLFWKWEEEIKTEDGWEDLGVLPKIHLSPITQEVKRCATCYSLIRIGKENKEVFQYCEVCGKKIKI